MFSHLSLSKSIFSLVSYSCRCVALVSYSCCSCSTRVTLLSRLCRSFFSRVVLVQLMSHSCRLCLALALQNRLDWKTPDITSAMQFLLQGQVRASSIQNSYSKQLFGKLSSRLASVFKKDSMINFLTGKFPEQLMDKCFRKFKQPFFQNTDRCLSMDEQEIVEK